MTTLTITPHESIEVRSSTPDALELEVTYSPGGKRPPAHFHPSQSELFEVHAGELHARVDGKERALRAGDTIEIPVGAVHQFWNAGEQPARATWTTTPAGRTLQWFEAIDALRREGRTGPTTFAALLEEYDDVFQLAVGPKPLVRGAVSALARVGRLRR